MFISCKLLFSCKIEELSIVNYLKVFLGSETYAVTTDK